MIAVDIGNTKTAFGLFEELTLVKNWQIPTDIRRDTNEYRRMLTESLRSIGKSYDRKESVFVSSVVPQVNERIAGLDTDLEVHMISHKTPCSFHLAIPEPSTLGADRIAVSEAAIQKYGAPVIAIGAGTATTFNVVNRNKEFIGGAIHVGMGSGVDAMLSRTSQLSLHNLQAPKHAIGATTETAIASGAFLGHAAMIEGMVLRILGELGENNVPVIVTGGSGETLAPFLDQRFVVDPSLLMVGIAYLSRNLENRNG